MRQRVLERLNLTVNPMPTRYNANGWSFGAALRASNVYEIALWEPGVRWIDNVKLLVEKVPDRDVESIATDAFQQDTWFAGSGQTLFRSLNDGAGWEPAGEFEGQNIEVVRAHPERPGLVAAVIRLSDSGDTQLHISRDCGETWQASSRGLIVHDVAWALRDGNPLLYIATDNGLYELAMTPDSSPLQILVDPSDQTRGFYAVEAFADGGGVRTVVVASMETQVCSCRARAVGRRSATSAWPARTSACSASNTTTFGGTCGPASQHPAAMLRATGASTSR